MTQMPFLFVCNGPGFAALAADVATVCYKRSDNGGRACYLSLGPFDKRGARYSRGNLKNQHMSNIQRASILTDRSPSEVDIHDRCGSSPASRLCGWKPRISSDDDQIFNSRGRVQFWPFFGVSCPNSLNNP